MPEPSGCSRSTESAVAVARTQNGSVLERSRKSEIPRRRPEGRQRRRGRLVVDAEVAVHGEGAVADGLGDLLDSHLTGVVQPLGLAFLDGGEAPAPAADVAAGAGGSETGLGALDE